VAAVRLSLLETQGVFLTELLSSVDPFRLGKFKRTVVDRVNDNLVSVAPVAPVGVEARVSGDLLPQILDRALILWSYVPFKNLFGCWPA
jgi:hypothetical protein